MILTVRPRSAPMNPTGKMTRFATLSGFRRFAGEGHGSDR
jgi:hypothetical protein